MLNNTTIEAWEVGTVDVLLRLRTWAMRYGASPLKVWDMLSERTRLATRRSGSVAEWVSTIMRSFQISSVDSETSAAIVELSAVVGKDDAQAWLTWVEDSHQFLLAAARMRFDQEKKARKAKTEKSVKDASGLLDAVGAAKKPKRQKPEPTQGELI